jgi:hypothetical protein
MTEGKGFAFLIAQSLRWDFRFRVETKKSPGGWS